MDAKAARTVQRLAQKVQEMSDFGGTNSVIKPLIGTDEANIDDKGRILVSKKKRERLGEPFTIALGSAGCLVAYTDAFWQRMLHEMSAYDNINQGKEHYTRLVLGLAEDELKFDAQGRVVIPSKLRELAQLKDKVLLIGCGERMEIWALGEYDQFQEYPDTYGQKRRESIAKAHAQMVAR